MKSDFSAPGFRTYRILSYLCGWQIGHDQLLLNSPRTGR